MTDLSARDYRKAHMAKKYDCDTNLELALDELTDAVNADRRFFETEVEYLWTAIERLGQSRDKIADLLATPDMCGRSVSRTPRPRAPRARTSNDGSSENLTESWLLFSGFGLDGNTFHLGALKILHDKRNPSMRWSVVVSDVRLSITSIGEVKSLCNLLGVELKA